MEQSNGGQPVSASLRDVQLARDRHRLAVAAPRQEIGISERYPLKT